MHRIGLVLFPGVQVLSLAPLVSVRGGQSRRSGATFYDVRVLSEGGGQIRTSIGATGRHSAVRVGSTSTP